MTKDKIPLDYLSLSDTLDMLGVKLASQSCMTVRVNGDDVQKRVENTIRTTWPSPVYM